MGVTIDPERGILVKTDEQGRILKRTDEKGNEESIPANMDDAVNELQRENQPLFNTSENVFRNEE
jgi:hypothetical protein